MLFEDVGSELIELKGAFNSLARDVRRSAAPAKQARRERGEGLLMKALAARVRGMQGIDVGNAKPEAGPDEILASFADRPWFRELQIVARASVAPAATGTSGWASEVVQAARAEWVSTLSPVSAFARLSQLAIDVPTRGAQSLRLVGPAAGRATLSGGFIQELAPIPVRKSSFGVVSVTARKAATISTFSEELAAWSAPAIEGILRSVLAADMGAAVDSVLVSNASATSAAPAGLALTAVTVTPSATGTLADRRAADISALVNAVQPAAGQVGLIVAPSQAASLSDAPGVVVIPTPSQTAGRVLAVDLGSVVTIGDLPNFALSMNATVHEEDTAPLALGTTGSPNVVAAPMRGLFQTDTIAMRCIWFVSWAPLRTGAVAQATGVGW